MRNIALTLLGSSGAIALGLPYGYIPIYGALGPAEAEFYDLVLLREECPCTRGIGRAMVSLAMADRRERLNSSSWVWDTLC